MTRTSNPPQPPRSAAHGPASYQSGHVPAQPTQAPRRVMPPMTEKNLQSAVEKLARFHGYELVYHVPDSRRSQPGFPDLVLASGRRSRLLFRELKTDSGRLRPEQKTMLAVLEACGQDAGVWRPADLLSGRIVAELRGDTHAHS